MSVLGKIPYINHARRHLPGGSDPLPSGGSRVWVRGSLIRTQQTAVTIPDSTDTRMTFNAQSGPTLGSDGEVEFDYATNTVRITEFGAGRVFFLRASILWDPEFLGGRQCYFLYNPSGTGGEIITNTPQIPMAKEIDRFVGGTDPLMRLETFLPAVTYITPGDFVDVELYVEQSSGDDQTCYGHLEVFGTMPILPGAEP